MSKTSYDELCRFILRRRLGRVFMLSAFSVFVSSACYAVLTQGYLLAAITPSTLISTVLVFFLGIAPPVVLRKTSIRATSIRQPTAWLEIKSSLSSLRTWRTLLTYATSGTLIAFVQLPLSSLFEPTRRHPWQLSESFVYLLLSNAFVGIAFAARDLSTRRGTVQWPVRATPNPSEIMTRILRNLSIFRAAFFGSFTTVMFASLYFPFRKLLLWRQILSLPIVGTIVRPFIGNFARLSHSAFSFGVVTNAILLAMFTVLEWNVAVTAFDVVSSHPLAVAQQHRTLIDGLNSSDPYFRHFAFGEMARLARKPANAVKRTALFTDAKDGQAWATLVRQLLVVLGKDYQFLLRRGTPAPPPAPTPPPPPAVLVPKTPKSVLQRGDIYKPSHKSPGQAIIDAITTNGSSAPPAISSSGAPSLAPPSDSTTGPAAIPSIFLSQAAPPTAAKPATAVAAPAPPPAAAPASSGFGIGSLFGMIYRYHSELPDGLRIPLETLVDWLNEVQPAAVADAMLPNRTIDVMAIQTLSYLISASLTEDPYGVVQKDIPRVMEALIKFLDAVESYQAEVLAGTAAGLIPAATPASGSDAGEDEDEAKKTREKADAERRRAVEEVIQPVAGALRDGVTLIAQTFRERLSAFKFPPETARRLQGFVDYL